MTETPPPVSPPVGGGGGGTGLRGHLGGRVITGSSWIMAGYVVQALTGVAFWVTAAHAYRVSQVGIAAALFASMQFVIYITALGLQEALSRHHSLNRRSGGALLVLAVGATTVVSMLGAAAYLALADPSGTEDLARFGLPTLVFGLLCAGNALALIVDVELTVARRWRLVFARLAVTGVVRVPFALVPFVDPVSVRLLLANAGPLALSGFIGIALVPGLTGLRIRPRISAAITPAIRYAAVNYASQLANLAPQFVLPVIVLLNVSPAQNASFFIAWTFTMLVWVLPFTISRVLLTEAGHEGVSLAEETRRAMLYAVGLVTAVLIAGLLGRPIILGVFGDRYEQTLTLLPLLLAGGVPAAVSTVLLGLARARDDHGPSVAIPLVLAMTTVGIAVVRVPDTGAIGAAWAWFIGNSTAALVAVALVAPRPAAALVHHLRRSRT